MYSRADAYKISKENYPDGQIQAAIEYNGRYILQIFNDDPEEGEMDPFFSVDIKTGAFKEFSVLTDGDIDDIAELFLKEKSAK